MADSERQAVRRRRGYWIALARKRKQLTGDALAELVGYAKGSGSVVSRWESGDRPVPSDRFERIAEVLDLPAAWLVKPPLTDSERLEQVVSEGAALERRDWEREEAERRAAADEPGDTPDTRSA